MKEELEIILIDDSQEDTDLALRELQRHNLGNRFLSFNLATEALDYLSKNITAMPRLILLDLNMPVMDGLEFIRRLKANEHLKDIPIAVLTGTTELPDIKESMKLGVKTYIAKPIEFDDIVRIAEELGFAWMLIRK